MSTTNNIVQRKLFTSVSKHSANNQLSPNSTLSEPIALAKTGKGQIPHNFQDNISENANSVTVKEIKEILAAKEEDLDNKKLESTIDGLMKLIYEEMGKNINNTASFQEGTQKLSSSKNYLNELKNERSNIIESQEKVRKEILELTSRIDTLNDFHKCLKSPLNESSDEGNGFKNQRLKRNMAKIKKNMNQAMVKIGLKEVLTPEQVIQKNDSEVIEIHEELLKEQEHNINELQKLSMINLKKPKYRLFMKQILDKKEPNEESELIQLRKVIKSINLLYGKINQSEIDIMKHRKDTGKKVLSMIKVNSDLSKKAQTIRNEINVMNMKNAFQTEFNIAAGGTYNKWDTRKFLNENTVPYNFARIFRDYNVLEEE